MWDDERASVDRAVVWSVLCKRSGQTVRRRPSLGDVGAAAGDDHPEPAGPAVQSPAVRG